MSKKKKYTTDNGHRCSNYGIYPDGIKCKGCSDCEGRYLKKSISKKQILNVFNKSHAIIRIATKNKKS
jgi:hypothetical protein